MKKRLGMLVGLVFFLLSGLYAQQLTFKTNAIGNDWIKEPGPHVQNHINNMTVGPDGSCYTQSVWDEGGNSLGVYKDGKHISNAGGSSKANSTVAIDKTGKTWTIMNYFGRFLSQQTGPGGIGYSGEDYDRYVLPVPTGSNAPYIRCSDGREIRTVKDPSAIGINHKTGELLVADQTEAQNIKIFDITGTPALVDSFGIYGGVWAGPRPGLMDNMLKFAGITGVGADANGNIYVSNTIVNKEEGSGGGVDLRSFKPDGTLNWRARGLLFLLSASVDPATDGSDIVTPFYRFRIDYSKPAGENWEVISTNINPFKYPDDPRLICSAEDGFAYKYINGNQYLLITDMYMNGVYLYRMDGEIAVPCAAFCGRYGWNGDEHNRLNWKWHRGRPDMPRWLWCDRDGDGTGDPEEFESFDVGKDANAMDIDEEGNFYLGTGQNNVVKFPTNGFDKYGNPQYTAASMTEVGKVRTAVHTMKWVEETDMFVHGNNYEISTIDVWKNWSKPNRSKSLTITLPPSSGNGNANHVTADKEYVYVTWDVKGGPNTKKEGEVTIYDINTGKFIGYITPGPEVGSHSGWIDMWHPTKVFTRYSGERIICVEEDHVGKVLVYQWCPDGKCDNNGTSLVDSLVITPSEITIQGLDTTKLSFSIYPDSLRFKKVAWYSSDISVVKVDLSGEIISTGVGSAWIKASSVLQPDKVDSCLVTVNNVSATGIKFPNETIEIPIGKTKQVMINFSPVNTVNRKIIWASSDETFAKIDSMGLISTFKEGNVSIIATSLDGGFIDTCLLKIIPIPVTEIHFTPQSDAVSVNDSIELKVEILPADAFNRKLNWESLSPEIASVDSNGVVKGLAIGTSQIIATSFDGGYKDTCTVAVFAEGSFMNMDIGNPCAKGHYTSDTSTETIVAGGDDIWNEQDNFHFVFKKWSSDGVIIARVKSLINSSEWAKAGVMFRESAETGSKHAFMAITPSNGTTFQRRETTNNPSDHTTPGDGKSAPFWVKLTRVGNLFTGYSSTNANNWIKIGEVAINMPNTLNIGLAVTSHENCTPTTAVFDYVIISENLDSIPDVVNLPPVVELTSPVSTSSIKVNTPVKIAANASDPDDIIEKVEFYVGDKLIGTDTGSPFAANYTFKEVGSYSISAKVYDGYGASAVSAAVNVNIAVTGIKQIAEINQISMWPNPISIGNSLSISGLGDDLSTIKITSMDGKVLLKTETKMNFVELSNLPIQQGIYLVNIIKNNSNSTKVLILK